MFFPLLCSLHIFLFFQIFEGDVNSDKVIHLFHLKNHFCVITKMAAFFDKSYWCEQCEKGYDHREDHKCEATCRCCLSRTVCQFEKWIECDICHRVFVSQTCFDTHKKDYSENGVKRTKVKPTCALLKKCAQCGQTIDTTKTKNQHLCGMIQCWICQKLVYFTLTVLRTYTIF
jgi:hypothetical protein